MTRMLKIGSAALAVTLLAAAAKPAKAANATFGAVCIPDDCTVNGQAGICCMQGSGSMTCDPCGGFKPAT